MTAATAAGIAAVFTVIGTGVAIYGQSEQSRMASAAAEYNARQQERAAGVHILEAQIAAQREQAQARNASQWANYNAQVADVNAKAKLYDAASVDTTRKTNVERKRRENRRAVEDARARFAGSGVVNTGSATGVLGEMSGILELDALNVGHEADTLMQTLYADAAGFRAQALVARRETKYYNRLARDSRYTAAAGTFRAANAWEQAMLTRTYAAANRSAARINYATTAAAGAQSAYSGLADQRRWEVEQGRRSSGYYNG